MAFLSANSELRKDRIFNFTLPAWYTRVDDRIFKTCPNAGTCAQVCYARNGTYRFSNVIQKHERNLRAIIDDVDAFVADMNNELKQNKFKPNNVAREFPFGIDDAYLRTWAQVGGVAVRIHDSGDFFADWYLDAWLTIAANNQTILFYAYTKEIAMFKKRESFPSNFKFLFSYGGLQDALIDPNVDRHADVFPNLQSLQDAGYTSQEDNDLYAVLLPTNRIGIVANNIPHFNKKINGRRFSELKS